MKTYQLDRIFTWLASAIGFNKEPNKKFFYDLDDNMFFNLGYKDGLYYQWTSQIPLSKKDSKTIQKKIAKLIIDKSCFLEIGKSDKQFDVLPIKQPVTKEEYEQTENQWKLLYAEVETFLIQHHINIHATRLIE